MATTVYIQDDHFVHWNVDGDFQDWQALGYYNGKQYHAAGVDELSVPSGAIIVSALINIDAGYHTRLTTQLYLVNEDEPVLPTSYAECVALTLTGSYVEFNPWAVDDPDEEWSSELKTLLQTIVQRTSYASTTIGCVIKSIGTDLYELPVTLKLKVTYTPVNSLASSPTSVSLNGTTGQTEQLTITATGIDYNYTLDVTEAEIISYESDDESVATVSSTGLITAIGEGTCTITATYVSKTVEIPVVVYLPSTIVITPSSSEILEEGGTQQLTVTGTYPDESTRDVTASSTGTTYTSSDESIATVSTEGLVTAVGTGTATITATNDDVDGTATITVLLPSSIVSTPDAFTLSGIAQTRQLIVTYTYPDGSIVDISDAADGTTYESDDTSVATVTADGLVRSVATGTCTITVTNGALTDEVSVTVIACNSLIVRPSSHTLRGLGSTKQLIAVGTYDDDTQVFLTLASKGTGYISTDTSVATVSVDGLVTAVTAGTCTIVASNSGQTSSCEIITIDRDRSYATDDDLVTVYKNIHYYCNNNETWKYLDKAYDFIKDTIRTKMTPPDPDEDTISETLVLAEAHYAVYLILKANGESQSANVRALDFYQEAWKLLGHLLDSAELSSEISRGGPQSNSQNMQPAFSKGRYNSNGVYAGDKMGISDEKRGSLDDW